MHIYLGVLQQTAPIIYWDERKLWNENSRKPHWAIKFYQYLNAQTRTVEVLFFINNWSLKKCSNMKQKENESILDYLKYLKQGKEILEANVGKDIVGHYVENIDEFNNAAGAEDKKKIEYEEFNKCMTYLLIANSEKSKYAGLANGLASQYSIKIINTPRN